MISPNRIIGSLVYRTREALNANQDFILGLADYPFRDNCYIDGKFNLWHYPGTHNEISSVLREVGRHPKGYRVKFPAILDYHAIRQHREGQDITIYYNLSIVASVISEWTTETREVEVFDKVLRPVYTEFMNQIQKSGYFRLPFGFVPHDCYEIFTTGKNSEQIKDMYGDQIDAIELHNLALTLRSNLCEKDFQRIEKENAKVTENINNILK